MSNTKLYAVLFCKYHFNYVLLQNKAIFIYKKNFKINFLDSFCMSRQNAKEQAWSVTKNLTSLSCTCVSLALRRRKLWVKKWHVIDTDWDLTHLHEREMTTIKGRPWRLSSPIRVVSCVCISNELGEVTLKELLLPLIKLPCDPLT